MTIPEDCREALGKRELRHSLKTNDLRLASVLALKLNEEALEQFANIRGQRIPQHEMSDSEGYKEALLWLEAKCARPPPGGFRETNAAVRKSQRTKHGEALAPSSELDTHTVRGSSESHWSRLQPTIADGVQLYLEERNRNGRRSAAKAKQFEQMVRRNAGYLTAAIGNKPIHSITRQDARAFRDALAKKPNLQATSVNKSLQLVSAIINLSITEFELPSQNPFRKLALEEEVAGRDKRRPFTKAELDAYLSLASEHLNEQAYWITVLQAFTGARTGELTGIEQADIQLHHETPHLIIRPNSTRPILKTGVISQRALPLVEDALRVVTLAMKGASESKQLFPRYASERGADALSAVQMKLIRKRISDDHKLTGYSVRHYWKDILREARIEQSIQDALLGHASRAISENYGSGYSLKALREAMITALKV